MQAVPIIQLPLSIGEVAEPEPSLAITFGLGLEPGSHASLPHGALSVDFNTGDWPARRLVGSCSGRMSEQMSWAVAWMSGDFEMV
jgi:hypothetical protein